jgi:hypothetical protein
MGKLWTNAGKLVTNAGGTAIIECDACPCGCRWCTGATPEQLDVTGAGFVPSIFDTCGDCANFNATFRVTRCPSFPAAGCEKIWSDLDPWECMWSLTLSPAICGYTRLFVGIDTFGALWGVFGLEVVPGTWVSSYQFVLDIGVPFDCTTLDATLANYAAGAADCDVTAATLRIVAVP